MTIRVSVIIPCYQQGRLLGQAIRSVLDLTRPALETIVIDDGSTDDTAEVAARFAHDHPDRVRLIRQSNSGQARARQAGLEQAAGDWILMLDADDLLEPTAIQSHERALARRPDADALAGDAWVVAEDGRRRIGLLRQSVRARWPRILRTNPYGALAGVLARADSVRRVGGLTIEGVPGAEDWDLWARMARVGMRIEPVRAVVASYRQSGSSYSRRIEPMLDSMLGVLARAAAPDPRLTGLEAAPPISPELRARLSNILVFAMLGRAVGQQAESALLPVLERLDPRAVDPVACHDEFLGNLQFAMRQMNTQELDERFVTTAGAFIRMQLENVFKPLVAWRLETMIRRDLANPWRKRSLRARIGSRLRASYDRIAGIISRTGAP